MPFDTRQQPLSFILPQIASPGKKVSQFRPSNQRQCPHLVRWQIIAHTEGL